ncbi:hypothetical protein BV20DRAFT_954333 [Pilatotrama ljubarskyi]|nr:hypothetical protein BV20DRAFT_954333 [Pilatotrama ljubarskyi]
MSTVQAILEIARKAIEIFMRRGLRSCLVGSVASYAYGVSRTPNDVDLVVLTRAYDQEELKAMLVQADPKFYLVRSRSIYATYKVLWYRTEDCTNCKVDVLVPGTMNIPQVPPQYIVSKAPYYLPLMPLIPHLLLKLQAWSDHGAARRLDLRLKQSTDKEDIDKLVNIVLASGDRLRSPSLGWMPESMVTAATIRLGAYLSSRSSARKAQWRSLGFAV